MRVVELDYTAGEVARATGVSAARQRSLRRHGYLPRSQGGWTRFSATEVATILMMKVLSDRGIPPATIEIVLGRSNGDPAKILLEWSKQYVGAMSDPDGPRKGEVWFPKKPRSLPRFLVLHDNKDEIVSDISDFFRDVAPLSAVVLDLKALGEHLVHGTGPIWHEYRET